MSIKDSSEVVTMAFGPSPEAQRARQIIVTFLKGPEGVQRKVEGRLERLLSDWLQETVWTVR